MSNFNSLNIVLKQMSSPLHLRTETDPVSEMLRFLASRIPDDGQNIRTQ
jgi:hypothetical protein